jgi:hypothetical protein
MFIEELDPSELVDSSSAPWQHDATEPVGPMRFTGGPSTGRGPSAPPAGTWSTHPADGDGPTVAFTGPTPSDRAPDTKPPTNRSLPPRPTPSYSVPQAMVDPTVDNGTLIMESPVNAEGSGPYPAIDEPPRTSPTPFARQSRAPAPMLHSYAPPEPMRPRATSHPDERVLSTAPRALATRSPPPKSSRALVFLGVVVVTMVVVIVGGMLILTFSD